MEVYKNDHMNFIQNLLMGDGIVGNIFQNDYLDFMVLYDMQGNVYKINADEKFEAMA